MARPAPRGQASEAEALTSWSLEPEASQGPGTCHTHCSQHPSSNPHLLHTRPRGLAPDRHADLAPTSTGCFFVICFSTFYSHFPWMAAHRGMGRGGVGRWPV